MCAICEHGRMAGEGIARHLRTDGPPLEVNTFHGWESAKRLEASSIEDAARWWEQLGWLYIQVRVKHD